MFNSKTAGKGATHGTHKNTQNSTHGVGQSNVGGRNLYNDGDQVTGANDRPGDSLRFTKEIARDAVDEPERQGAQRTVRKMESTGPSRDANPGHKINPGERIDRELERDDQEILDKKNAAGIGMGGASGHGERVKSLDQKRHDK